MIKVNTVIGYGCPAKQGKASAHGEPLGEENVAALKEYLEWPCKEVFFVLLVFFVFFFVVVRKIVVVVVVRAGGGGGGGRRGCREESSS